MNKVYIEIGGNQGDRLQNIQNAKLFIASSIGRVIEYSSIYETPPWGFESDQFFYNQVIYVETLFNAEELMKRAMVVEQQLGRVRSKDKYSSRTMDVDILFFNNEVLNTKNVVVPHPRMHLRRFVLEPMFELNKNLKHPILNKTIEQLLNECQDNSICTKIT